MIVRLGGPRGYSQEVVASYIARRSWNKFAVSQQSLLRDIHDAVAGRPSQGFVIRDDRSGPPFAVSSRSQRGRLPGRVKQLENTVSPIFDPVISQSRSESRLRSAQNLVDSLFKELTSETGHSQRPDANLLRARVSTKTLQQHIEAFAGSEAAQARRERRRARRARVEDGRSTQAQESVAKTFDLVREPTGGKAPARITPKPFPATLDVASPSHSHVRVPGLA